MRKLLLLVAVMAFAQILVAQNDRETIARQRANDLFEAFTSLPVDDREAYILHQYSKALLEKYDMSMHTNMLDRLSEDFGESEMGDITINARGFNMMIRRKDDGHKVKFVVYLDKNAPYLIAGYEIDAGEL